MKQKAKRVNLQTIFIWGLVALCTLILITLCFDEGLDYDEGYSWYTVHHNSFAGVWKAILDAHDTDIPLWYWGLKVWVTVFGESWFSYKLFSVLGTLGTMILGATMVRKSWGDKTAVLFILPVSLSPALMHNSVNVRMYSWTVFLVTACGLCIYWMCEHTRKWWMWLLLGVLTTAGLFCHYFTAFCYLLLYLYLLVRMLLQNKKDGLKVIACGVCALLPFLIWLWISDFFHLASGGSTPGVSKTDLKALFQYLFETKMEYSVFLGVMLYVIAAFGVILFFERFDRAERWYVLLCLLMTPFICLVMGYVSSFSYHFFIPRHILHSAALLWLGIAIVIPRINKMSYYCAMVFLIVMGISAYRVSYHTEYETIPYMEETKALIAERMEPEDIVVYNAEGSYEIVYRYYIREQEMFHVTKVQVKDLVGKQVWFLDASGIPFNETQLKGYEYTYEKMGHYGFRLSGNHTDFEVYRVEIQVKEP